MIYYLPIGDKNTASSRLRVFNIQPYIENSQIGIPVEYTDKDILIIQKIAALSELEKAKKQGARVIYDIDDMYWDNPRFMQMIDKADIITVDTEKKKEYLREKWTDSIIEVIPDSLDWNGKTKQEYNKKNIIGWTGYGNNSQYLNDIDIPNEFTLRLITDTSWLKYYKDITAQSRPWSIAMVDEYLSECDLGIYYLPERRFELCKGMHKLLKNWAIGLPTITSRTPDYVKAMNEAGVGDKYLIDDWSTLKYISFDEKCREYAMQYKAEEIAKLWRKILQNV